MSVKPRNLQRQQANASRMGKMFVKRLTMSIPDHEIEEPDNHGPFDCAIHLYNRPCPYCRDEAADRQHDDELNKKHGMD